MERYRIAVALGIEFPFKVSLTRGMIRQVLTKMLGVQEKDIIFKPGTYLINRADYGEKWLSIDDDNENFRKVVE